jgi:hypothetical protein
MGETPRLEGEGEFTSPCYFLIPGRDHLRIERVRPMQRFVKWTQRV